MHSVASETVCGDSAPLFLMFAGQRLSGSESSVLARQKELLLQKLETFEATNRTLRSLLREQHGSQVLCATHLYYLMSTSEYHNEGEQSFTKKQTMKHSVEW